MKPDGEGRKKRDRAAEVQAIMLVPDLVKAHADLQEALGWAAHALRRVDLMSGEHDGSARARARLGATQRALASRIRQAGRAASIMAAHAVTIQQLLTPPPDWREVLGEGRKAS